MAPQVTHWATAGWNLVPGTNNRWRSGTEWLGRRGACFNFHSVFYQFSVGTLWLPTSDLGSLYQSTYSVWWLCSWLWSLLRVGSLLFLFSPCLGAAQGPAECFTFQAVHRQNADRPLILSIWTSAWAQAPQGVVALEIGSGQACLRLHGYHFLIII